MGYDMFKEFICSFLKIEGNKLGVNMKFNHDMQEISDWYEYWTMIACQFTFVMPSKTQRNTTCLV